MKKLRVLLILAVALLLVAGSTAAWASGGPPKDSLVVVAGTSGNGISPHLEGANPEWFYAYVCVPSRGDDNTVNNLSDTIPVTFTLTGTRLSGGSVNVSYNVTGNPALASAVSVSPSPTTVAENGGSAGAIITLGPVSLADGNYVTNVQMSTNQPGSVQIVHDTIHIQVRVGGNGCAGVPVHCFITDSSFGALSDCNGNPVAIESETSGTFQIVYNSNKITATNPGQFYYNEIWTNDTGSPHNITLTMSKSNLNTTGTNALHVMVFQSGDIDPSNPVVADFNLVNTNGTPCGTGGTGPTTCKVNVTIQPGETLFVTWHLAYSKIGQNVSAAGGTGNKCPGTEVISATGIITDTDTGDLLATCTATATGYLKK